jgi:hypothetical protein
VASFSRAQPTTAPTNLAEIPTRRWASATHIETSSIDVEPGPCRIPADDPDDRLVDDGEVRDADPSCGAEQRSRGSVIVGLVDLSGVGRAERRR